MLNKFSTACRAPKLCDDFDDLKLQYLLWLS